MHSPFELPSLRAVTASPREVAVDLLIALRPADAGDTSSRLSAVARQDVTDAAARGEPVSDLGRILATAAGDNSWPTSRVIVVGLGPGPLTADHVRRAVAAGTLWARERRYRTIAIDLVGVPVEIGAATAAAAEAVVLANFNHGHLKSAEPPSGIREASVLIGDGQRASLERGLVIGEAINAARLLANEPGNVLTPRALAERAADLAAEPGVQAEILGPDKIEALGMGLLMGVARGSHEPARLLCLTYTPPGGATGPVLGLVGKGITFDTGGISIKPADGMERMKDDMAGGAAVVAAVRAIARLGVPRRVVAVVPATENMPGGNAIKPGDVVTTMSGQTVEILNTDAEGRLILCDALTYVEKYKPSAVVDVATLTGAMVIALGHVATGLFANSDPLARELIAAGEAAWDRAWHMPLWDDYQEGLKSNFADFPNIASRAGGSITAACYLSRFTKSYPWAHLDIAGTGWKSGADKGATGRPVPLLTHFLVKRAA